MSRATISMPSDTAINLAFSAAACAIGLVGFHTVFGGWVWATAAGAGLAVGTAVAWFGAKRRADSLLILALLVVAYFLLSGVALPDMALAGVLPTLDSLSEAAVGAVQGWVQLLTTLPPVGGAGSLAVVPLLCALAGACLAGSAALRTRRLFLPLIAPLAVAVIGILFGTDQPANLFVQGALFAVLMIAWVSYRQRRTAIAGATRSLLSRAISTVVMFAVAATTAVVLGDHMPGVEANERFVLRDRSDPPFDPRTHPSPLASFRHYKDDSGANLQHKTVLTVAGKAVDQPLRLAVLDEYDGMVWRVGSRAGAAESSAGVFRRVGERIPPVDDQSDGSVERLTLTANEYNDIWVPSLGTVERVRFRGAHRRALADDFRFNRVTNSGVVPRRLRSGDVVEIEARVTPPATVGGPRDPATGRGGGDAPAATVENAPSSVKELAEMMLAQGVVGPEATGSPEAAPAATSKVSAYDSALRLSQVFINDPRFGYSDGENDAAPSRAGHSAQRLDEFAQSILTDGVAWGNAEQYASLEALMAHQLGLPTRVVMGFCPNTCTGDDPSTKPIEVAGDDVTAWAEVNVEGVGWVALPSTPRSDKPVVPNTPKPQPRPENAAMVPPMLFALLGLGATAETRELSRSAETLNHQVANSETTGPLAFDGAAYDLAVGPFASFGQRLAVVLLDTMIQMGIFAIGLIAAAIVGGSITALRGREGGAFVALLFAWTFLPPTADGVYHILGLMRGQTPGMQIVGMRIISEDGTALGFWRVIGRNLASLISLLTFGVGYLAPLWTPKRQTFHDTIMKTVFVPVPSGRHQKSSFVAATVTALVVGSLCGLVAFAVPQDTGTSGYADTSSVEPFAYEDEGYSSADESGDNVIPATGSAGLGTASSGESSYSDDEADPGDIDEAISPRSVMGEEDFPSTTGCDGEVVSYGVLNLIDGDYSTAWGGAGDSGQSVVFEFAGTVEILHLGIVPGYARVAKKKAEGCAVVDRFAENRVVTKIRVTADDGFSQTFDIDVSREMQWVEFATQTSALRIEVLESWRPSGADIGDDVFISEIAFT